MSRIITMFTLALLTVSTAKGEVLDSLQILVQQGDSLMQQYNTYGALDYFQQAFDMAMARDSVPRQVRLKLADCHYKRGDYRQTAELLKNMPDDSLTHEAFRQVAYSYKHQGDLGAFIYWAEQLLGRYPMDGEVVAALTRAYTSDEQPQKGIVCGMTYCQKDSTNILVNRAVADAWFVNRDFSAAAKCYERLLEHGDSTFNTLYSAGMCYTKIDSLERAYQCLKPALWLSNMGHYGAAYRLGVVCIDTKRYDEGLGYLSLALELMKPDSVVMRAITLSQGEGYYLTNRFPEAVNAWKQHIEYNPGSVATYYNIANTLAYLIKDEKQANEYFKKFLEVARQEPNPTFQLTEMMKQAEKLVKYYSNSR